MNTNGMSILVTGSSSGIGMEIARILSYKSYVYAVGIHYNSNKKDAETLKQELSTRVKAEVFQSDFSTENSSLVTDFVKVFGKIDVLVNCASTIVPKAFEDMTIEIYDMTMKINARTPFFLTNEAFEFMKRNNGGKIINISSNATKFGRGGGNLIHYAASKSILDTLTEGLSRIGADYNILVNSIRPGAILTQYQRERGDFENRRLAIPLKRYGTPSEIAHMVEYLCSPKGDFITGQIIKISGGE